MPKEKKRNLMLIQVPYRKKEKYKKRLIYRMICSFFRKTGEFWIQTVWLSGMHLRDTVHIISLWPYCALQPHTKWVLTVRYHAWLLWTLKQHFVFVLFLNRRLISDDVSHKKFNDVITCAHHLFLFSSMSPLLCLLMPKFLFRHLTLHPSTSLPFP